MRQCTILIVGLIGPAVRADFRRLYPANAKTPMCCPSDDNRTKVTNSVTSARSLWWHVGPYFWHVDLTRTANPIVGLKTNSACVQGTCHIKSPRKIMEETWALKQQCQSLCTLCSGYMCALSLMEGISRTLKFNNSHALHRWTTRVTFFTAVPLSGHQRYPH